MRLSMPLDHDAAEGFVQSNHHPASAMYVDNPNSTPPCTPGFQWQGETTLAVTLLRIHVQPFIAVGGLIAVSLVLKVTTAAAAGKVARIGIYAALGGNSNGITPGALILDAGTVAIDSTGQKGIIINEILPSGYGFLAGVVEEAVTLAVPDPSLGYSSVLFGGSPTMFSSDTHCWFYQAHTATNALPSSLTGIPVADSGIPHWIQAAVSKT